MDWKDTLAGLTGLPCTDDEAETSAPATPSPRKSKINIFYERKGRGGKEVTILADTSLDDSALADLASRLKKRLGTGGSCRGGEILIQGDRRREVNDFLRREGFTTNL